IKRNIMKTLIKCLLTLILISLLISTPAFAQEIQVTVSVNREQLTEAARRDVSSMANDLTNYINNQRFTNIEWKGKKIPVDLTIYLSGGSNNHYTAKLFIISRRYLDGPDAGESMTMKMIDNQWNFDYYLGANLTYNNTIFNTFTSLINYYILLAIGYDQDTYGELDGTPAFDLAKSIVELGSNNSADGYKTYGETGEFTRFNLVNELTGMQYQPLRKIFFSYYVDALDIMSTDRGKGIAALDSVMTAMATFKKDKMTGPSVMLQAFFDTKAQELGTLFNGYPRRELFDFLRFLDPTNSTIYNDSQDGKYGVRDPNASPFR
ncbi:MAG: DUF4835 family protein, partial [FCB group bacterium]